MPKSTNTPENPTTPNLRNLYIKNLSIVIFTLQTFTYNKYCNCHHQTQNNHKNTVGAAETLHIDVYYLFFIQKIEHHDSGIVHEMHDDARPDRARHPKHVTEHQAEDETWKESVEIGVESRENKGCHDDSDVCVFEQLHQSLLYNPAEQKFLAYCRQKSENYDSNSKIAAIHQQIRCRFICLMQSL